MARTEKTPAAAERRLFDDQELSIIRLAEPVSAELTTGGAHRTSDVSGDGLESASPASLAADLEHYKVSRGTL